MQVGGEYIWQVSFQVECFHQLIFHLIWLVCVTAALICYPQTKENENQISLPKTHTFLHQPKTASATARPLRNLTQDSLQPLFFCSSFPSSQSTVYGLLNFRVTHHLSPSFYTLLIKERNIYRRPFQPSQRRRRARGIHSGHIIQSQRPQNAAKQEEKD